MIRRLMILVLLAAVPGAGAAQDTVIQPAPDVSTNIPALPLPTTEDVAPDSGQTGSGSAEPFETAVQTPEPKDVFNTAHRASERAQDFLVNGGPSIWAIAVLSVITLALILWKIWRLALIGAWSRGKAGQAVQLFEAGDAEVALATVAGRRGVRSHVVAHAIRAIRLMSEDRAREETARVAKREIAQAGTGLRALELIATIAPLLGLLGTVLGMIAAFQALQQAGNRADPALLAGGIWEALLTTAAGMAVAIPASAALTWFEAVIDRIRRDVEDGATRLFVASNPDDLKLAAE
ncbi:MAG: MotA/TolQ/ExbB proton channel family protein [Pseudomonadota bacterium]